MLNNVPEFLYKKLNLQYGDELTKKIIQGYSMKRKTTLRVNTIKSTLEEIEKVLIENNIEYSKLNWYKDAVIIENASESDIRKLNIYSDGKIYLQSLSSMLPPVIMQPQKGENILDMTAAPGGKTTQICALSSQEAFITACEKNKVRAEKLKYNIEKQGAIGVNILVEDARKLDDYFSFDKILLDAPCSGSGTINLFDKNLDKYFNEELLKKSVKIQRELLKKAINILKPGHEMVYSTCSILKEENEDILSDILKNKKVEIVPIKNDIVEKLPKLPIKIEDTLCVCPDEQYEGFFVAKLRKIS